MSDISHQTKTPLSNILLYTQLLRERVLDEQSAQLVNEIKVQSEKLAFLIQSLVKISRLETGTFQLSPGTNDLNGLIWSVTEQIAPAAKGKDITILYDPVSQTAVFDSKWTAEALFNILDNAVKYTPEHGRIEINVKAFEMFSCISVSDSGIGISEEDLDRIWNRFYQADHSRSDESRGVGLGLSLAQQIARLHGGRITASSWLGEGSEFIFSMPGA